MIFSSAPSRERTAIMAILLVAAAAGWAVVGWQATQMGLTGMGGLTMGAGPVWFLAVWVAMMVAMMFPAAAPMILMFNRVHHDKRERGESFVPTWIFVGAYILVWTGFGAAAFAVAALLEAAAPQLTWLTTNAGRIAVLLVILAGLYQLSPVKNVCLQKCRSPLSFLLNSWRDGYGGAVRMGIEHGLYCLGCCWLLFLLLFPLGLMNIPAMAAITLVILAEKALPMGRQVSRVASVALVAYGVAALFVPALLPAVTTPAIPMESMPPAPALPPPASMGGM